MGNLRDIVGDLRESFFGFGKKPTEPSKNGWAHGASTKPLDPKDYVPKPKWTSAGCVVLPSLHPDDLNFVYVIKPSNNYGPIAFPKGRIDKGETAAEAARRETQEEAGLVVSILPGGYLGKGEGGYSVTHFFMAVHVGGSPGPQDHEVESVKLVTFEEAWKLFKAAGNARDLGILQKAWKFTERFRARSDKRDVRGMEPVSGARSGTRPDWKPPKPQPVLKPSLKVVP